MVKGGVYQNNLAGSMDTDLLMLVLQMISEIPPVVNSNMRSGIFLLLFKVAALVELCHYALRVKVAQLFQLFATLRTIQSIRFSRPEYQSGQPFPSPGDPLNPGLPHCTWILYQLSQQGSPRILDWVAYLFSSKSSQPRNRTRVSCIAGGFFTN